MGDSSEKILTDRQGHPIRDNQSLRSVGERGPATLENYHFIEKITHFDRERIPERVVHARGTGAHGFFEAYGTIGGEPASTYTSAKLLQTKGQRTPVFVRFSTVIHGKDSPETLRDPRGFAVKFYTEDGNWDLVGNNLKIFFIRDAIKFPDFIHSFKPDPVTNRQDPNRQFDFISLHPESINMITYLFSPRGIPADYRHQEGAGVNTYKLVNAKGEAVLCKFHWIPKAGVKSLTQPEAEAIQAKDFGHASRDLYEAIERKEFPEWELMIQVMPDGEHPELDFDPLDDTKIWPEDQFSMLPAGRMVLDRNPSNVFAETEQAAFGTGVLVEGIDFSDDKMLQGRTLSYSDTQRYRVGPNYLQLPINAGRHVASNQRDGIMARFEGTGDNPHVNYEPSTLAGSLKEAPKVPHEYRPHVEGELGRYQTSRTQSDYQQAGERYRAIDQRERDDLINNLVGALKQCAPHIQERMVWHFLHADEDYGRRVAEGIGVDVEKARSLSALPGRPAPGQPRAKAEPSNGQPNEVGRQEARV
ncbi:MAG: catalase [Candidatus Eremiobacter antarcticus]|nr:catalase [Candidatus Eremiobacteraeota bacterium]MBC5807929.1 catalase [Candidatus Eremiobacteraeota bacterium]PZR62702.1 MAG: catalase [Candidatus Eremiobacter sp. RRmetagenome_bin22]